MKAPNREVCVAISRFRSRILESGQPRPHARRHGLQIPEYEWTNIVPLKLWHCPGCAAEPQAISARKSSNGLPVSGLRMTALIRAIKSIAGRDGIEEAEAAFRVITKPHPRAAFRHLCVRRGRPLRQASASPALPEVLQAAASCRQSPQSLAGEAGMASARIARAIAFSLRITSLTETVALPARSSARVASAIAVSSAADLIRIIWCGAR